MGTYLYTVDVNERAIHVRPTLTSQIVAARARQSQHNYTRRHWPISDKDMMAHMGGAALLAPHNAFISW